MTAVAGTAIQSQLDDQRAAELAAKFIEFLETGQIPDGLYASDVFTDVSLPTWRLQARGIDGSVAIRQGGHPVNGRVVRHRVDSTPSGFVLELEERWTDGGQDWYCRELFRADVSDEGITQLTVYCTGDWDEARVAEHRAQVTLLEP